jgi:membrane associated rhomboid family serine protease
MSSLPPPPPPPSPSAPATPPSGTSTCYRHPARPAFRRCTRCERVTCDECLTPGSIGSLCPECVKAGRPPAAERMRRWNATRPMVATYVLIAINVAVAIYTLTSPEVPRSNVREGELNLAVSRHFVDIGEWYRIFTSGFTHFGIFHLVMNMFSLYFLGQLVEPALTRTKYVMLYFASLLAGTAGALVLEPDFGITAGASGAIFGLLGAAAIALKQRGIGLFQTGIGMTLVLNLVLTFGIDGISIGGHLGGLLGGAICGYVMLAPRQRGFPKWAGYATPAVVAAVAVAISFAVSAGASCDFIGC